MTVEFPDLPPADVPPCETCGSSVHLEVGRTPARGGVSHSVQIRVCDSRSCPTNNRSIRRGGDIV
jgi:hypothetical protein